MTLSELIKYGRILGYEIQQAKHGKYRIVGEDGEFTYKQIVRIVLHMETERIDIGF